MTTAQSLFDRAFFPGRPARSKPYRSGVMDALRFRLGEAEHIQCPYPQGSVEFDAYFAGVDEGHLRYKRSLDEVKEVCCE